MGSGEEFKRLMQESEKPNDKRQREAYEDSYFKEMGISYEKTEAIYDKCKSISKIEELTTKTLVEMIMKMEEFNEIEKITLAFVLGTHAVRI